MSSTAWRIRVSAGAVLVAASVCAQQFTEPSKVLPPPARKTTESGPAVTIQPNAAVPQPTGQTKVDYLAPASPSSVNYGTPEATSLSARQTTPQETPLLQQPSPWLSTPLINWFESPKESLTSWQPAAPAKASSFDQPATSDPSLWQPKPVAPFDAAVPASSTHSWDDKGDSRLKGSKVDWK